MALQAGRVGVRPDQVDAYGRVNDTSFFNKIIDKLITWVDLLVWKGGTEQLLPENDDEPETSPILCDIDYPDQEREDQYFTYRESPTGSDGIAKIESIRGNTLVWNQLIQNGNFENTTGWSPTRGTVSASSNVLSYTITELSTSIGNRVQQNTGFNGIKTHKYYVSFYINLLRTGDASFAFVDSSYGIQTNSVKNNLVSGWNHFSNIFTNSIESTVGVALCFDATGYSVNEVVQFKQLFLIDLTLMFGAGNEPTTVAEFENLFPLPYYKYDTGSLLNFTADKIKTVGKNLVYKIIEGCNIESGGNISSPSADYSCAFARVIKGATYVITNGVNASSLYAFYEDDPVTGDYSYDGKRYVVDTISFTAPITGYVGFRIAKTYSTPQLEFGTTRTTYEPYTTNTIELPISDFFPTGMKSAGEVYDELLPRRATTNVGSVDLGTLSWTYDSVSTGTRFYAELVGAKKPTSTSQISNILCVNYTTVSLDNFYNETVIDDVCSLSTGGYISIRDTTYNNATAFTTAMNGVMLNYELAEPIVLPTIDFGD